jgi:hypothetical protein
MTYSITIEHTRDIKIPKYHKHDKMKWYTPLYIFEFWGDQKMTTKRSSENFQVYYVLVEHHFDFTSIHFETHFV